MSDTAGLLVGLGLLLANAFFVAAEFAVVAARRSQIEPQADAGRRSATTALWAMEHVSLMLATAQLGITVCSIGLGAIAEPALAHLIEPVFEAAGLPSGLLHPVAFVLALGVVVFLHVVIGEMVPKNLSLALPDVAVLVLAPPLVLAARISKPVVGGLNAIANGILRLMRVEPKDEVVSAFTLEEVASIVEESKREGLVADHQGLLGGAIDFSDRTAADVMVALDHLAVAPEGATPDDVEQLVASTGFSRFPVVDAGEVVGYLHLKDVLYADEDWQEAHSQPVPARRLRALITVARDAEVEEVLASMQRSGTHLARVASPRGETEGVVFLEDVLEELVGEVRDAASHARPQPTA